LDYRGFYRGFYRSFYRSFYRGFYMSFYRTLLDYSGFYGGLLNQCRDLRIHLSLYLIKYAFTYTDPTRL
jgi:hypothetical protein